MPRDMDYVSPRQLPLPEFAVMTRDDGIGWRADIGQTHSLQKHPRRKLALRQRSKRCGQKGLSKHHSLQPSTGAIFNVTHPVVVAVVARDLRLLLVSKPELTLDLLRRVVELKGYRTVPLWQERLHPSRQDILDRSRRSATENAYLGVRNDQTRDLDSTDAQGPRSPRPDAGGFLS